MVPPIQRLVEIFFTYFACHSTKSICYRTILCIRVCIDMVVVQSEYPTDFFLHDIFNAHSEYIAPNVILLVSSLKMH
jgi:hypothetical protein